jgi:hypothetical protein
MCCETAKTLLTVNGQKVAAIKSQTILGAAAVAAHFPAQMARPAREDGNAR